MSIFQLDLALEIIILVCICLFGIGLVIITAVLLMKCRNKDSNLEVNRGQRVQEISSIDIRVHTEVSRENEKEVEGGQLRSTRGHVRRTTSTYVHCPSPTYEATPGLENPGFLDDEHDFINAIYSL